MRNLVEKLRLVPLAAGLLLAVDSTVWGQQATTPNIGYVYPAGGRQGATVEVTVGGQFLDGATNVLVSGTGVSAKILEHFKPLTPQQFNALREKLKELQERRVEAAKTWRRNRAAAGSSNTKAAWNAEDERTLQELRKKLAAYQRRPMNPAIAERVRLQMTLAADAEPGRHELKVLTRQGLSNPLVFCVGQIPEVSKPRPAEGTTPNRRPFRLNAEEQAAPATEMRVNLPVTVNGQVLPGGLDRYRFTARKGQHFVAVAAARELVPYLADAVPGWFQATLTLRDSQGTEVAYDDDYRFHPDPVLHCEIPADGEYLVEIKDAIYRGREDFVYRLSLGELPFVTGIFPLGGRAGEKTELELTGWNLPQTKLTENNSARDPGVYPVSVVKDGRLSNRLPFAVDTLPEVVEREPNNSFERPQSLSLPVIVNGRIGGPRDMDTFRFEGKGGEEIVVEVLARRLESPLDSVVQLTDVKGGLLAVNDDCEDKGSGLSTHHADSYLRVTIPTNGTYAVTVSDREQKGGPDYAYRLRIGPPRPDFELRVVPSSVNARPGLCTPVRVYALRKDGFSGAIALLMPDAPAGFQLTGAEVPQGQDQVRFTLAAPAGRADEVVNLTLKGRATIDGHAVVRTAVPADDRMQAFAYHHLVPADNLQVVISGRGAARFPPRLSGASLVKIPAGGTAKVVVGGAGGALAERFELELNEPPDGITLAKVSPDPQGASLVLEADASKAKPGVRGNLIVNVVAAPRPAAAKSKKQANARRFTVGALPAIPFEIVGRE